MQDEINEKVIALYIKGGKITARLLQKAIKIFLAEIKKQSSKQQLPHGKQSLEQLMKQNTGISNIEITDKNIKAFEATAKKYRIDFALKKDSSTSPPRHLVFFKGRDADVLKAAFTEFSQKKLSREKLPSIRKVLSAFKEQAKAINKGRDIVKHKDRGIER
nr:PcfB family protein [Treponema denticola]